MFIFLITTYFILKKLYKKAYIQSKISQKQRLLIILGSGGHTQEMILMSRKLQFEKISHLYIVSSPCDRFSHEKYINQTSIENQELKKIKYLQKILIPRTNCPEGIFNKNF